MKAIAPFCAMVLSFFANARDVTIMQLELLINGNVLVHYNLHGHVIVIVKTSKSMTLLTSLN